MYDISYLLFFGVVGICLHFVIRSWWKIYVLLIPLFVLGCFCPLESSLRQYLMMFPASIAFGIPLVLILKNALLSGGPSGIVGDGEITYRGW